MSAVLEQGGDGRTLVRRSLPSQVRTSVMAPATFDDAENTVEVVFSKGALVQRVDFNGQRYSEELLVTPDAVDLSRIEAGAVQVLDNHDAWSGTRSVLGVVERGWVKNGEARALVRLTRDPAKSGTVVDIKAGIIRAISVGYTVQRYEVDEEHESGLPHWTAVRWMPQEISFVSVPADPQSSTRAAPTADQPAEAPCEFAFQSQPAATRGAGIPLVPQGNSTMTIVKQGQEPAEAQTRAADISDLCHRHAVGHLAADLIRRGVSLSDAKDTILTAIAVRDAGAGAPRRHESGGATDRDAIVNTLASRMGVRVQGPVISSVDCVGLASRALAMAGVRVDDGWNRSEIIQRAMGMHTTSDFPALLGAAARRVLHEAYEAAPVALKALARRVDAADFRERSIVRMSTAPSLEKVGEHGEFKYGTASEASASWKLATYGKIIGVTRQSLVNDDLGGFASLLSSFGDAAARREADELYAVLTTPPVIDGAPLFSAERSTLIGDALDLDGLSAAVLALRKQRDLSGALIAQEPAYLVVPAALEMRARQLVASFTAMQASDVQPFTLKVAVEPRLDAVSATAWYLVASRQTALEYGYLDGNEGVQITQREGFEVDGIEIKARLDFGCGWGAPLGWVKSNGDDQAL